MIYLASPYTHKDHKVMIERFKIAERVTALFLKRKEWVFSPIVHCHALALSYALPHDFDFWRDYDQHMISHSDKLVVLALEGWSSSKGVQAEITYAYNIDLKVKFVNEDAEYISFAEAEKCA